MQYDPEKHLRKSIRIKDHDYSQNRTYFITICTYRKQCLFGDIIDGEMKLSEIGNIANKCWNEIPKHFDNVSLDYFVIMPNHIYGIIILDCRDTACRVPTVEKFGKPTSNSIPTIIRSYKSAVSKRINKLRGILDNPIWQQNYYEHIVRNDDDVNEIREYIMNNPIKRDLGKENIMITENSHLYKLYYSMEVMT